MLVMTPFDTYRMGLPNVAPITAYERDNILNPLLKDNLIVKSIGLKMLTDEKDSNDLIGLMLAAGGRL